MSTMYRALVPVDHTGDKRVYPVGATFTLDHILPEKVRSLIEMGAVEEAGETARQGDTRAASRRAKPINPGG